MVMAIPNQPKPQNLEALEKANEIRLARAKLKKDIREGRITVREILKNPPECIDNMSIFDLIVLVPRYGRARTNGLLMYYRISPTRMIKDIGLRQRQELIDAL